MSRSHVGIPLLSGPPPPYSGPTQSACRRCGKEFNIFFNRRRECMHCGYDYCSSCTDYQALMPRRGPARGYDVTPVCGFCFDVLNVTALGRSQLRSLPLAKLRRYIDAYNIPVKNPVDKNDLVDAILAARIPQGCLPPVNEDYYRKHSVPSYSTPGSSSSSTNRNSSPRPFPSADSNDSSRPNRQFPRPDLDPNRRRPQETPYATYTPRTPSNQPRSRTTSAPSTQRPTTEQPNVSRPNSSAGQHSTSHTPSTPQSSHPQPAPPLPPPPMSTLVTLPRSSLAALSVGTLKQIIWEARVRIPPGVVEKEDLVDRVWALVEEEKRKDEEALEDGMDVDDEGEWESLEQSNREEEAVAELVNPMSETHLDVAHEHDATARGVERGHGHVQGGPETTNEEYLFVPPMDFGLASPRPTSPQLSASPPNRSISPSSKSRPRPQPKPPGSGLCVVCQDEEACIAIVDCGHLALCRACSDLILASSRECPLCRTRIVTEARLLRIFKT